MYVRRWLIRDIEGANPDKPDSFPDAPHEVIAPDSDITFWATGNPLALTAGRVNHFSFDFAFQEFDIICHEQGIDCKSRAGLALAPEAMTAMHYQRVRP